MTIGPNLLVKNPHASTTASSYTYKNTSNISIEELKEWIISSPLNSLYVEQEPLVPSKKIDWGDLCLNNVMEKPSPVKNVEVKDKINMGNDEIKLSDLFSYKSLNKYTGLLGKEYVRANSTYIGLEVELEGCNYNNIPSTWKVVEDHSLKEDGLEFVTVPIQAKYVEMELVRLFAGINKYKTTSRCSVHVHLNARDFTLEELEKFILLYMIFERSLYRFSGDRWNNNFCIPIYFYPNVVKTLLSNLKYASLPVEWYKYSGLNICPIWGTTQDELGTSKKYGTIEFRHMKGTGDIPYILKWINLIISLKIAAKKIDKEELYMHINTMNTTSAYYYLAETIFKESSQLITKQPTFKEDIESCISLVKEIACIQEVGNVNIPIISRGGK